MKRSKILMVLLVGILLLATTAKPGKKLRKP